MKVTLTAKLKLNHTEAQKAALDAATLAFRDALNYTSKRAFDMNKCSGAAKIQKEVYTHLREVIGLPSQMACSAPRQVAACYKGLWTKCKDHHTRQKFIQSVKPGHQPRPFRGFEQPAKFVSRTLEYQYGKDYTWKKDGKVSVLTLEGRQIMTYQGYSKHLELIQSGCEVGGAKLSYQKSKKQYFLLVSLEVDLPDPQPADHKNVVGVDVGQRFHAVVTNTRNRTTFFSGQQTNHQKEGFARVRQSLQRKGTRSATRRLVLLSGRERRFIADRNHSLASQILKTYPQAIIGLENLKDIRTRTEGRSNPQASLKAKRARRRRSQWSFAELQTFLAYKASLVGSMALGVDAHYTSQQCVKCGHTSKGNRPQAGLMFVCEVCGYQVHSDLLGARNVTLRALAVRQDWTATGALSVRPDVSSVEAKAERLQRYSELRWSSDTSLRL
ncbi:transposase [Deinococcus sp. QL22]|uniref:RNA-guided endonuclease InsQ/TnpB family protein n=1 Tax=Deinococcus sp. QL22 TaxID=2939437 RepID=UPI0020181407|nr:transposase [Deinococcus sp. QL22]UQN08918.1 transposase [Deinococcus sp. QL22]